jgi:2-keto-3-deoxy-L-rhamnonate aldolase RhmA
MEATLQSRTSTTEGGGKSFKRRLESGVPQIGIRNQICSPIVTEALGFCGFDYVYLDMEHSPSDLMVVLQQCHALGGTPAVPVVRIPSLDQILIQRLLDIGVENIVVPMIETVADGERAAAATRFPPHGIRSFAGVHRGNQYGGAADYLETIEGRLCLILQIESQAALQALPDIAQIPGVTGVYK